MQLICRNATSEDYERILAINQESLPGVAVLDRDYFEVLIKICEYFRVIEVDSEVAGYIFAMDQDASYDAEEFQWFGHHLSENFFYIDQVAIGQGWRNNGFGRLLYKDLEEYAVKNSVSILACEVNYDPPNEESQAFHRQLGFREIGRMDTRGLTVSMLVKRRCGGET